MGKSGGKWIKQVLFGKKSSKSRLVKKTITEKEPIRAFDASTEDLAPQSRTFPDELPLTGKRTEESLELEKGDNHDVGHNAVPLLPGVDNMGFEGLNISDAGIIRREKAASKVQATFRGYLARRAFRVLKGIIRLQALIRGHLVRRQAIATLVCMRGIVNLQRLIRRKGTSHVKSYGISTNFKPEKLLKNSFICKLLASTTAMPLNIHYDPVEPNSTENWLERWSSTCFWEPLPQQKKATGSRFQKHQSSTTSGETERNRTKRVSRRVAISNVDNNSVKPLPDIEKPNRGPRKTINHRQQMQQQPQNELERVKGNLRKVAAASKEAHENSEALPEKPKSTLLDSTFQSPDEDEKVDDDGAEIQTLDDTAVVGDSSLIQSETPLNPLSVGEPIDVLLDDCPAVEAHLSINDDICDETLASHDELTPKEENTAKMSQKAKRRMSFPAKREFSENISLNTSTVPSYMAVTESAKAKLRAHGSARISQDGVENGFVRRHSLPSSNNGNMTSMSPRMQKQVQVNGKGGSRTDRSLLSSRDGNEKPGWRR